MKKFLFILLLVSMKMSAFESGYYKNQQTCEMLISCQKITDPAVCNGYVKKTINGNTKYFDIYNVPYEIKNNARLIMQKREVRPDPIGQPVYHHVNGIIDKQKKKSFSVKFQSFYNDGMNYQIMECGDMNFSMSLNDLYKK